MSRKLENDIDLAAAIRIVNKIMDVRMGMLGAISMGSIVYWINMDHGVVAGLIAASKQGLYTFFFGALFVKLAENIASNIANRALGVMAGGIIPALLTTFLTYCLHAIKGTPEPFHSTIPTLVLGTMSFSTWAYLKHREAWSPPSE
ncbi:MAG: hypothetical protein AAFQ02_00605 [Bacteroidota bacterium]